MKDVSGRELKNRAIVLVYLDLYGLQFAVIDNLSFGDDAIEVLVVFENGKLQLEPVHSPELETFIVSHRQLPEKIKDKLIELSEVRIMGPADREALHKKLGV